VKREIRYYQQDAYNAVMSAKAKGHKRVLITMPGGTGKTFTCANIIKDFGRKCWITHEESLAEQSAIAILTEMEILPEADIIEAVNAHGGLVNLLSKKPFYLGENARIVWENVGMVKADIFDIDKPLVICSAQTLWRRLDKIPKDWFSVIVCDEGDLFGSVSFKAPLDYLTPELIIGATATAFRGDGMLMEDIFEALVYDYPIEQAIKDKYLTEINAIVVRTSANLDEVHSFGGDFNQKELVEKVNTLERNNLIVNKYIEYCSGQQFICFGADVQHVIDLHEAFKEKGIVTTYVVSDKDKMEIGTDRKTIVRDFREGKIMGLVNYNIFSAGFDVRDCGCVILGCPTKSKRKFLQQLYRVTRLKTEKFVNKFGQIGTVLDIVDGTSKHKLINTHELDKGKPIEDRVFVSNANKQLLIEARVAKDKVFVTNYRKEDKVVDLFKLPLIKISDSMRMGEMATEAQLNAIAKWDYDIVNTVYTKRMISEIFGKQEATAKHISFLKWKGYDTSGFVSVAEAAAASKEIKLREEKLERDKNQNNIKNNLPFKF